MEELWAGAAEGALFPQWLDAWSSEPDLVAPIKEAQVALARRGNSVPDSRELPSRSETAWLILRAASAWSSGDLPRAEQREAIADVVGAYVRDELSPDLWTRFLLLEKALVDAMRTGDQLFAASLLRTMLEEVAHLLALTLGRNELIELAGSQDAGEEKRLRLYMTAVCAAAAPVDKQQALKGTRFPKPDAQGLLPDRARMAKRRLNGFVHPNYGSHVAALYPESREAATVLLDAIVALYEATAAANPGQPAPPPLTSDVDLDDRDELLDVFGREALARSMAALSELGSMNPVDPGKVLEGLRKRGVLDDLEEEDLEDLFEPLPKAQPDRGGYRSWAGSGRNGLIAFAGARRAEERLRAEHPAGCPDQSNEKAWLAFNVSSLELVGTVAHLKSAIMRTQLLRQLCRGNPLGIVLCARGLIENLAVSLWLPNLLANALDQLGSGDESSSVVGGISRAIAEVLTTNASGDGIGQTWAIEQDTLKPRARIDLPAVVRLAFPIDEFWSKQYDFGSAVMHGRVFRSLELSADPLGKERSASGLGLLVLAKLDEDDIDVSIANLIQGERMRHSERRGSSTRDGARRWTWGFGEKLEVGRDYSGSGTRDDPFVLAEHVHLVEGSRQLAAQELGPEVLHASSSKAEFGRPLVQEGNDALCDVWRYDARELWVFVRTMTGRV